MKFGNAAAKLSAAASVLLGWRPDEFWNATPVELANALIEPDCVEGMTLEELKRRFPDDQ